MNWTVWIALGCGLAIGYFAGMFTIGLLAAGRTELPDDEG